MSRRHPKDLILPQLAVTDAAARENPSPIAPTDGPY